MNLAIRNIDSDEVKWGDSLQNDLHKDLRADFILANPPFNESNWKGDILKNDVRWKYGIPPEGNANFAWVQHFIHHLSPTGITGFVLANGSMSSNISSEGEIRKNIIEADLVDCMVALPPKLFFNTGLWACLWFLTKDKSNSKFRNRKKNTLFIDARNMGAMTDRGSRIFTDDDIKKISSIYHTWRDELGHYEDIPGLCKSSDLEEIKNNNYVLTPGRYVCMIDGEEDNEEFEDKMQKLISELKQQMAESAKLDEEIKKNLERIGFDL